MERIPKGRRWGFASVALVYVAAAAWGVWAYRFQIDPDGISYVSIARRYAAADFAGAVNEYWSPLYSWLMALLLLMRVPALVATKVVEGLAGLLALGAVWRLGGNLRLSAAARIAMGLALVPVLAYMAVNGNTPDLLSAAIVLAYLAFMTRPDVLERRSAGIIAGLLGGIGFLSKAYVSGFFLVHFVTSVCIWMWRRRDARGRSLFIASTGLATFALVAGAWIAVMSGRAGHFTAGSTGAYNLRLSGGRAAGIPMHTHGFLPPSNASAVSAWDDPTLLTDLLPAWSPLEGWESVRFQLKGLAQNLGNISRTAQWFSIFSMAILLASVLMAGTTLEPGTHRPVLICVTAMVIYPMGYLLFDAAPRLLSPLFILTLVMGVLLVEAGIGRFGGWRRGLGLLLVCASFVPHPLHAWWRERETGRLAYERARQLEAVLPKGARIASDHHWHDTLYIAFHDGLRYYGETKPGWSAGEVEEGLRRYGVEYFLVWSDAAEYGFLREWKVVGEADGVRVYRVGKME